MAIELNHVYKAYDKKAVLTDFNGIFDAKEITGITGPSGVGKTTLLRLCAGLETPDAGTITGLSTSLSMVFQENRLVPWLTVHDNIAFVLDDKDKDKRIESTLRMVGLWEVANEFPRTLSGGMAKRIALARAFCHPSELLLMDEPFTGLDLVLKEQIITDFKALFQASPRTVLMVSHQGDELASLCHCIIHLNAVDMNYKLKESL